MMHKAFFPLLLLGVVIGVNPGFLELKPPTETAQSSPDSAKKKTASPFPRTPHAFANHVNAVQRNTTFSTIGNETGLHPDPQFSVTGDNGVRVYYLREGLYFVRCPLIDPSSFLRDYHLASAVALLEQYGPKYKGHYIVERTDYRTLRYFKGGGRAPKLSDKDKRAIRAKAGFLILDDEGRKVYETYKARLREEQQAEIRRRVAAHNARR